MQAVRFFLLNASLIAVGLLALFAVVQSLIYSRRRILACDAVLCAASSHL